MCNIIKLLNNVEKVFILGKKQVWCIISCEKGKLEGDYIIFDGVDVVSMIEIKMFYLIYIYIKKMVCNFDVVFFLVDIFKDGKLIYNLFSLIEIQDYVCKEFDKLWDEYKCVFNFQYYLVDLVCDVW